jgi:undecaprenyl diphosphate synthase
VRALVALALANARYWPTVAPVVHAQLHRWEQKARLIPNRGLRDLALGKLAHERFNAEVAATLATLAPRAHRKTTVEAIVALEVMYDYLDGLTEQPCEDPLTNGRQLFRAFTDAVTVDLDSDRDYYRHHTVAQDGGYLGALANTVRMSLSALPAGNAVAQTAQAAAARCAEAQTRANAVTMLGHTQLEQWAKSQAKTTGLHWREFTAGAVASVLCVHALIAASANARTTSDQAAAIDRAYLSISALSTMLDSLVDREQDASTGTSWLLEHYSGHDILALDLVHAAAVAASHARRLPHGPHHLMTLTGVVAYYTSAATARNESAEPVVLAIQQQLQPLLTPTLAVMRTWRLAKQLRRRPTHSAPNATTSRSDITGYRRSPTQSVRYLAIITDGNRRWARAHGLPISEGHLAGADTLKERIRDAAQLGVEQLTVYSFSTENWRRPLQEVHTLLSMLAQRIASETPQLHHHGVRMRFIGRRHGITTELAQQLAWAEQLTAHNDGITLFIALNYGARAEILDAARGFHGTTEQEFRACLYAPDMHDPQLLIRTGGEQRLSNYLLWQSANCELVFRDELWPDFSRTALNDSIAEYRTRQRRLLAEQQHPRSPTHLEAPVILARRTIRDSGDRRTLLQ